jgi:hypothetical protein
MPLSIHVAEHDVDGADRSDNISDQLAFAHGA